MFPRLALCCLAVALSTAAAAQVKVGLMVSATGPTTAIGIPQKNTGDLLPRKVGDATVEYVQLDDGGDTTRAVQNIKKLIQEKPDLTLKELQQRLGTSLSLQTLSRALHAMKLTLKKKC